MRIGRMILLICLTLALFSSFTAANRAERLRSLTLEEKIGQMLLPAFRVQAGHDVTEMTPELLQTLRQYRPGGVILFRENLLTPAQTAGLINELQSALPDGIGLFIGVDQEGGRITRLPYGTAMPGNLALGATGNPGNGFLAALALGEELAQLGFNLNFAPVLDVNSNPANPVIGDRSFGEDPTTVGEFGKAFIRGLQAANVATVVKHFPGHGDTGSDSHVGLPVLSRSLDQLETVELKPFRLTLAEKPDMVMTAHIALPAIERERAISGKDGSPVYLPATLSHTVLTGILRQRLGYDGVIITDALNMKAISEHFGPAEAAVRAVKAGADILLMPDLAVSYSALLAAVRRGDIPEERIDQSVQRILAVKGKYKLLDRPAVAGQLTTGSQTELGKRLAAQAVTLLKNDGPILPFTLQPVRKILLLAPSAELLAVMQRETEIIQQAAGVTASVTALEYTGEVTPTVQAAIVQAEQIVLATNSVAATGSTTGQQAAAVRLAGLAAQARIPLAVLAARSPYDLMYLKDAPAFIAVYTPVSLNIAAGLQVIFGQANPAGKLPVSIPAGPDGGAGWQRGYGLSY